MESHSVGEFDPGPVLQTLVRHGVQELKRRASVEKIEGLEIRVASIDHLIAMREAAGRTKDRLLASQLRALSDALRRADR